MNYITLGTSKQRVSQLGLGCINFGTTTKEEIAFELIDCYLENGGNVLDTANNYAVWNGGDGRESERVIGAYLKKNQSARADMVLCTKLGALSLNHTVGFTDMQGNGRKTIFDEVHKSLEAMNTEVIDLLYLHVDDYNTDLEETLGALAEVINKGYVKQIGCSNFRTWRIEQARSICQKNGFPFFSAVQQKYSYLQPVLDADFGVQVAAGEELKSYIAHYKDLTMVSHTSLLYGAYQRKQIEDIHYQTKENEERMKRVMEQGENAIPWVLDYITKQFGGSIALFTSGSVKHLKINMGMRE